MSDNQLLRLPRRLVDCERFRALTDTLGIQMTHGHLFPAPAVDQAAMQQLQTGLVG